MDLGLKYVNSNNINAADGTQRILDLSQPPFIGERSNDLFGFKWDFITQGQALQRIVKFEKRMVEKKFHVLISGENEREYFGNLERFLQYTDVDINNLRMGRLYVGKYYLECYIFASGKVKKYLGTNKTLIECTIVCENGNWLSEKEFTIKGDGSGDGGEYRGNGFIYPYDFKYDYAPPFSKNEIYNESYLDTDFELTFYGATSDPRVTIGGNLYAFEGLELEARERATINSKDKTCILTTATGETRNIFNMRNRNNYIYEKIKGGNNVVLMDDVNATISVRLYYERSEPKWSDEQWI